MSNYTEEKFDTIYDVLDCEEDDYIEKLKEVFASFRSTKEVLDNFLVQQGYDGILDDLETKLEFVKNAFKKNNVDIPRNLKPFFQGTKDLEKSTAFQFCFAFELDLIQSENFIRRACMERGFDCHDVKELVYYFCIKNKLPYSNAKEIISQIDTPKITRQDNAELLFTEAIVIEVDKFENESELINYINNNKTQFGYNNVTAVEFIRSLWSQIDGADGLAMKEKLNLLCPQCTLTKMCDNNCSKCTTKQCNDMCHCKKCNLHTGTRERLSEWDIYLQILGFGLDREDCIIETIVQNSPDKDKRTLKPILNNNDIMHPIAAKNFPDRQGMANILKGEHLSDDKIRKTLILLSYYVFWCKRALQEKNATYAAKGGDNERFLSMVNDYLIRARYPALYAGDPYDWIFMYCNETESPLHIFRQYMHELYILKEDEFDYK